MQEAPDTSSRPSSPSFSSASRLSLRAESTTSFSTSSLRSAAQQSPTAFSVFVHDLTPLSASRNDTRNLPRRSSRHEEIERTKAKPSLSLFLSHKPDDRPRKVQLQFSRNDPKVLSVLDSDNTLLYSVDLTRLPCGEAYMVHPSASPSPSPEFSPNVLYIDLRSLSRSASAVATSYDFPPSPTCSLSPITSSSTSLKFESDRSIPKLSPRPKRPSLVHVRSPASPSSSILGQPDGLYFQFPSAAALKTWFALLQSIMIPEIYSIPSPSTPTASFADPFLPPRLNPSSSSDAHFPVSYRLKRKLTITIKEARYHAVSANSHSTLLSPLTPSSTPKSPCVPLSSPHSKFPMYPTDTNDEENRLTTSIELRIGSRTIARTTSRKRDASPYFSEEFIFDHFGSRGQDVSKSREQVEPVTLIVWREKKGKTSVWGELDMATSIMLGETIEGWFPLLVNGICPVGELRLKIVVMEQMVFPLERYSYLSTLLADPVATVRPLWRDINDQDLFCRKFMRATLARGEGELEKLVALLLKSENLDPATLFRSSSLLTKCLDSFMKYVNTCLTFPVVQLTQDHLMHTTGFLNQALSRTITKIVSERISIEIRPANSYANENEGFIAEKQRKHLEQGKKQLASLVSMAWDDVYAARGLVPSIVRNVFSVLFHAVEFEHRHRAISSILFLRLLSPAILNPHLFALTPGMPSLDTQKTLVLLAKSVSGLSFGGLSEKKEGEIHSVVDSFVKTRQREVVDFITAITTREESTPLTSRKHDVRDIEIYLRNRPSSLHHEGLHYPPYYQDEAASLATISSTILRAVEKSGARSPNTYGPKGPLERSGIVEACRSIMEDELQVESLIRKVDISRLFPYSSASPPSASLSSSSSALKSPPPRTPNRPTRSQTLSSPPIHQLSHSPPTRPPAYKLDDHPAPTSSHRSFSKASEMQWQLKSVGSIPGDQEDSDFLIRLRNSKQEPSLPSPPQQSARAGSPAPLMRSTSHNTSLLAPDSDDNDDDDDEDIDFPYKTNRPTSSSTHDFQRSTHSRPLPRTTVSQRAEFPRKMGVSPLGMLGDMRSASEGKIETRSEGVGRVDGSPSTSMKRRGFFKAFW